MPETQEKSSPPTLSYAPPPTLRDRIARHFPSGDQVITFLKNMIWVAPLTLLIWVYAEREQSITGPPMAVSIDVKTVNHDRVVSLRKPADKNIIIEVSGPRARLERVRELLQPKADGPALQIDIDPQLGPGTQELLTLAQINNSPIFKNNGLTVKSAQPAYLVVDIDKYERVSVPVRAPKEIEGLLSDQTHFEPEMVDIRAPSQLIERARTEGELYVCADLARRADEIKARTGPYKIESVPVYWPIANHRENVIYTPLTVRANLDIKPRDVEYTIPRISVSKITPPDFEVSHVVKMETAQLTNVTVTGPAEQIERLRGKQFIPEATFKITGLEETGKNLQAALKIDLPPGVQLTKDSQAKFDKITFVVNDR